MCPMRIPRHHGSPRCSSPCLAVWFALLCCAGPLAADLVLTEDDNGRTAGAQVGQSIAVRLRGNPSTGFAWVLASLDGSALVADGDPVYIPDPGGGAGTGGTFEFAFRAATAGSGALAFDYRYPWDPLSTIDTFAVTVVVTAPVEPPRLFIELVDDRVELRWLIAGSEGFLLEGTPTLSPARWSAPNVVVVQDGDWYKAALSHSGERLFFRLHKL